MGFLAPWFLAGVAAVGLPVYLHLLRRHATTPRPFSSLMFFEPRTAELDPPPAPPLSPAAVAAARAAGAAGARLRQSLHQSAGRARAQRQARAAGHRQLVQHARGLEAERRQAGGDVGARAPAGCRSTSRSWRSIRSFMCSPQPTQDSGDAARRPRRHPARRLPRQLRRARSRRSSDRRQRPRADRAPSLQRHAAIEHGAERRGHGPPRHRHARPPSGDQGADSELDRRKRHRPGPALGQSPRTENRRASRRLSPATARRPRPAPSRSWSTGRPWRPQAFRCRRRDVRPSSFPSLDVPYGFSRCEVRIDSADALPADDAYLFAVEHSDPLRVLFVHAATDSRSPLYFSNALTSAAESAFTLQSVTIEQAANLPLAKYALRRALECRRASRRRSRTISSATSAAAAAC